MWVYCPLRGDSADCGSIVSGVLIVQAVGLFSLLAPAVGSVPAGGNWA